MNTDRGLGDLVSIGVKGLSLPSMLQKYPMITSVYVRQFQCPQDVCPLEHVGEIRLSIAGHGPYRWRPGRQISFRLEPQSDIPNSNTFKSFSLLLTLDKITNVVSGEMPVTKVPSLYMNTITIMIITFMAMPREEKLIPSVRVFG